MRRPGKRHQIDHAFGQVVFIGVMVIVLLLGLFAIRDGESRKAKSYTPPDATARMMDRLAGLAERFVTAGENNFNQRGGE